LKDQFFTAAKSRDRTGAQLLRDFMRDYVKQQHEATEHDSWFRREVQIGLDAANAGDVVSADEVEAEAVAWRAETRRKMAGAHS
jgi:predicted transcriptional regulator